MAVMGQTVDATDEELQEFVECVRLMMRDYSMNNILLDDVQFNDDEIRRAISLATSEYNRTPIRTTSTWREIPEDLLFLGAARWLMQAESFLQIRNQVSVPSDGLGVIGIDDKYQLYFNQLQEMKGEFKQGVRDVKDELNISRGFGHFHSGYASVSRFHHN